MALFLFLVLSFCIPCHEVDARSKGEHERHHRLPRSREVKSMLLRRENEFECVDIYKQPAFDHPLLKNHKIQLNPTFRRDRMQSRSSYVEKVSAFNNLNKGCPPGKVPIYRRQMRHEKGSNTSSEPQLQKFSQYSQQHPNHHFATLDTTPNTTYLGAIAALNVYNLTVKASQYSLGQIWLQSGPPAELNSIQAGWGVHPSLYGDSLARLTGYWTSDNFHNTGCFNLECSGFVQVHENYTFGDVLSPTAVIGSLQKVTLDVEIIQDQTYGHWWLTVAHDRRIGYWPKELLTNLGKGASLIRYGGETFAPSNMNSPPMGTGYLAESKFRYSCFFARLQFVDSQFKLNEVNPGDMKINCDASPSCYDLLYDGYEGPQYRQAFLFGGPGGQCGI